MTFEVTILGSGAALPKHGTHHSAHVLNVHEQFYLIDCGEGTQTRLMDNNINPMKLNAVFLTHLHGDHVYGLFPLLSTLSLMGRKTPLHVFGPRPLNEIIQWYNHYFNQESEYTILLHEFNHLKHEVVYENKVMEVMTVPLKHRMPCSGFFFREKTPPLNVDKKKIEHYGLSLSQIIAAKKGEDIIVDGAVVDNEKLTYRPYQPRSYAYLSDTVYSQKAARMVEGVDVLYHEATFSCEDSKLAQQTRHSTTWDAAKAAIVSGAGRLIIGHISARYKDTSLLLREAQSIFPDTGLAIEGTTIKVEPRRDAISCPSPDSYIEQIKTAGEHSALIQAGVALRCGLVPELEKNLTTTAGTDRRAILQVVKTVCELRPSESNSLVDTLTNVFMDTGSPEEFRTLLGIFKPMVGAGHVPDPLSERIADRALELLADDSMEDKVRVDCIELLYCIGIHRPMVHTALKGVVTGILREGDASIITRKSKKTLQKISAETASGEEF